MLRQLNATETDAQLFGRLAGSILYANTYLRADGSVLSKNQRSQSGLWGYAISGDLPIVLLQISDAANVNVVRQMLQAHAYWRAKGLTVDLVITNDDHSSYRQLLHDQIMSLVVGSAEAYLLDRPGGVFIRRADQITAEDRILLQTVARVIILDDKGTLVEQLIRRIPEELPVPQARLKPVRAVLATRAVEPDRPDLVFDHGIGGFSRDGREYNVTTGRGRQRLRRGQTFWPIPNLGLSFPRAGRRIPGAKMRMSFGLTPRNDDPVCDPSGEAYSLRDEETGYFWSPTPLPKRGATSYITRHGFGFSVFEHSEAGISSELWVYVALDAPVKFADSRSVTNPGVHAGFGNRIRGMGVGRFA